MLVRDLHALLSRAMVQGDSGKEIRIGDQIESGPYLHASVGGIFQGSNGEVVICANDDAQWTDEQAKLGEKEMPVLWQPEN